MRQKFFSFLIFILIIFAYIQPTFAKKTLDLHTFKSSQLTERKLIFPDWRFPSLLNRPGWKEDLIYPNWFEGEWNVTSKMDGDENQESIFHSAKFIYNSEGNLIADREYNTQSYALNTKDSDFLSVKNDPDSPNRQFAKLTDDRYLETKIVGRLKENTNDNSFITDELILQILHTPEFSRVSQVETLTEFTKCSKNKNHLNKSGGFDICGEQFQAIYNPPGQSIISKPIKLQKFKLVLSKIDD